MKKQALFRATYLAWLYIALLFGAHLYFSENSNLDDPIVPLEIPLIKDALWLVVAGVCLYIGRRAPLDRKILLLFLLVVSFCIIAAVKILLVSGSLDVSYLRVLKNLILYVAITFLFINVIIRSGLEASFTRTLHTALLISMIVSLLFYLFHPVQSHTERLFGTYGNPNTAGFVVVYCVALYFALERSDRTLWRLAGTVILGGTALILSASFSAIIALAALLPIAWLFRPVTRPMYTFAKLGVIIFVVIAVLGTIILFQPPVPLLESTALENRIEALAAQGLEHETVTTRLDAFAEMFSGGCPGGDYVLLIGCSPEEFVRFDSTITSFGYHFGVAGLLLLAAIVSIPYIQFARIPKTVRTAAPAERMPPLMALLTVVTVFNLPIQHAFEIFPINFLFATLIAMVVLDANALAGRYRRYAAGK